nr:hypothetical protein [Elizabethkingia sp. ASV34]
MKIVFLSIFLNEYMVISSIVILYAKWGPANGKVKKRLMIKPIKNKILIGTFVKYREVNIFQA